MESRRLDWAVVLGQRPFFYSQAQKKFLKKLDFWKRGCIFALIKNTDHAITTKTETFKREA